MDLLSLCLNQKNTIDPEKIINDYGADSVRLFILSDSPPEKDIQWSEQGIASSYKFIQKLWNLNNKFLEEINKNNNKDKSEDLDKFTSKFIKKITNNLENFHYNVIIANIHEMYSFLIKELDKGFNKETLKNNYAKILVVINPIVPHFSNECLEMLNVKENIGWPTFNEKYLQETETNIVVQINGKKRGLLKTKKDISEENVLKKIQEDDKLRKFITGEKVKKQIYIKNKIINLII